MRTFICALLLVIGLAAQDGISRQMASVERQKRNAAGPGGSLQRQQAAVARQTSAIVAIRREQPWDVTPSEFGGWRESASVPACPSLEWDEAKDRFEAAEERNDLPSGLLSAVARQESGLYPCAVSRAGAAGLMQLMPATAAQFGVGDPFDPWQSLQGGGQFLKQLLGRYDGDLRLALGAYNAGPARVDFFGGVPPFPETQNYVESVMSRMKLATASGSRAKP